MSFIARGIRAVEQAPVPDAVTRAGIEFLCARTARRLAAASAADEARFADWVKQASRLPGEKM